MLPGVEGKDIRITRVYDAPLHLVWDAWTDLKHVEKWWGPRGFTLTTHEKDLRPGGTWRYTMHGPDGVDYPNIATYHEVEPYKKLVYDHGATETTPPLFRVTVTFSESNGRTTMEMVSTLPSPEAAREIAGFIKQVGGTSTWDRLAEHLEETERGTRRFVINRSFIAPIERVFEMWTNPEHLVRWLPPVGSSMRLLRSDIAEGKAMFFVISGPHGTMHVRAEYQRIEAPHCLVYTQQFVDAEEQLARAPGADTFPATLRNTVLFAQEGPSETRVTLTTEVIGKVTEAELAAFVQERSGMALGWTGSFDALESLL